MQSSSGIWRMGLGGTNHREHKASLRSLWPWMPLKPMAAITQPYSSHSQVREGRPGSSISATRCNENAARWSQHTLSVVYGVQRRQLTRSYTQPPRFNARQARVPGELVRYWKEINQAQSSQSSLITISSVPSSPSNSLVAYRSAFCQNSGRQTLGTNTHDHGVRRSSLALVPKWSSFLERGAKAWVGWLIL